LHYWISGGIKKRLKTKKVQKKERFVVEGKKSISGFYVGGNHVKKLD
jgi:hypothetical protein